MPNCLSCEIYREAERCGEMACCAWYMDNVVCGDKAVSDCTEYRVIKD